MKNTKCCSRAAGAACVAQHQLQCKSTAVALQIPYAYVAKHKAGSKHPQAARAGQVYSVQASATRAFCTCAEDRRKFDVRFFSQLLTGSTSAPEAPARPPAGETQRAGINLFAWLLQAY